MVGPVVGSVLGSWVPVVSKFALRLTAAKPMESHVNCLSAAWLDVVGDDTMSCAIVCLDGCGRLLVGHLFEGVSHWDCFTGIDVEAPSAALAALDMTALRILDMLRMAPLLAGSSTSAEQKK
jgi:hypothetical protein